MTEKMMEEMLAKYDLDFSADGWPAMTYVARLWHDGDIVLEQTGQTLAEAISELYADYKRMK